MRAKTIIPAAFMCLGAATTYFVYSSTQNHAQTDAIERVIFTEEAASRGSKKGGKYSRTTASLKNKKKRVKRKIKKKKKKVAKKEPPAPKLDIPKSEFHNELKPLLTLKYSEADVKAFKQAYALMRKNRFTKAKKAMAPIKDPLVRRCLHWYDYKSRPQTLTYTELKDFWTKHPDWPALKTFKTAAESKLISADDKRIREYLAEQTPISSAGLLAQANLLLSEKKNEEATKIVRHVWREGSLSKSVDKIVMKRHKDMLRKEDHHFRAQRYLYKGRSKYVASALRVARPLDKPTRKLLDVQIAALRKTRQAVKKILALSDKEKLAPNIIYARVKRFRKKKQYEKAWDLLQKAPSDPAKLVAPKAWWKEKRRLILEALNRKKYKVAYELAKNHGQNTANELNDAEFLAGWISLRYLKKPKEAYEHFKAHSKSADGPRSRSRSSYWLGRTSLALGDKSQAKVHFEKAAVNFNTFYGQLSRQSLNPEDKDLKLEASVKPTAEDIKRFISRDAMKVVILANQAEQDRLAARFLSAMRYKVETPGEMIVLAEFAKQLGHTQMTVRIGKTAMFRGIDAVEYAYPVHAIPKFKPLRSLPEKAFIYAIARQESEFNTKVKSHVGARGLMQVMPATAKLLARQYKIRYNRKKLSTNAIYNVRMGTAYISDRLDEFSGSYIKTIAGYNAGPGRVRQWVKQFGDPSSAGVDPIDWIERIPFHETRNYVQKVIANLQVYRALLESPQNALRIRKDLYRGRKDSHKASSNLFAAK